MLLVSAYSGLGNPHAAHPAQDLPQAVFAGLLRLGRRARLRQLQGHRGSRAAARGPREHHQAVRAAGAHPWAWPPTASSPSAPTRWRNRPRLALKIHNKFPRSVFFAGKLLFEAEKWYYPLLHNETAYAISRRLQLQGIPMVVMPIRILGLGR
ncbi:MAG: hypothetical protein WDO13_01920 [Verrucomicrobiota bacterium]